jgi:uncharacterized protein YuzE
VDGDAGAAYLQLSTGEVARTVEFSEDIYVDLDRFNVVVGIELLDLAVTLPLDALAERFHVSSETLRMIVKTIQWVKPEQVRTSTATDYVVVDSDASPVFTA